MEGIVLIQKDDGKRSLFVPSAHIRIRADKFNSRVGWQEGTDENGEWFKKPITEEEYILSAFRTDGQWVLEWEHVPGGQRPVHMIPIIDHLMQTCVWSTRLEVPSHIVQVAIESDWRRREAIDAFAGILERSVALGNKRKGLQEFLAELGLQKRDTEGMFPEEVIAKEVYTLISSVTGGGYH